MFDVDAVVIEGLDDPDPSSSSRFRSPLAGEVIKLDQVRVPQLQSRRSSRKVLFRLAPGIYFPQFFLYIEPCLNWNFLQEQPENGTENVLLCFGNKFQERLVLIHRRK